MARGRTELDFTFRLVPLIARLLEARGVSPADREKLLALLPPNAASAPEITAPLATVQRFLDGAAAASGLPALGLAIAAAVPRGTYSWVEFIARLSTSLQQAMSALSRYYRLLNKGASIVPFERPGHTGLEIKVPGHPDGWGRHLNEYTVALFDRIARELMPDWRPTRVWFAHDAPGTAALEALAIAFGVTPSFGQTTSGFEGERALAQRPLASGDAGLQKLLELQASEVLAQQGPDSALAVRVRAELVRRLGKEEVGIEEIAQSLSLNARTLQRRLDQEGLSFQDLLDGTREQFAKGYLAQPGLAVGEIAYLLGYSDLRAFDRAFRRWTGKTPVEWRDLR